MSRLNLKAAHEYSTYKAYCASRLEVGLSVIPEKLYNAIIEDDQASNDIEEISDDGISDLHKEVHGFRPSAIFMKNFRAFDEETQQNLWDALCAQLEEKNLIKQKEEAKALVEFRDNVRQTVRFCNTDWRGAVRFLAEADGEHIEDDEQTFDHFLWSKGLGYSDRRNIRKLYKDNEQKVKTNA